MPQFGELLMFRSSLVILFILALGHSSQPLAGVVPALLANFDADTVGETPDPTLPGDPIGDRIQLWGSTQNTVVAGAGAMTNQPLRIQKTGGSGITKFVIAPELATCEAYVLTWTAMIETNQASTTFTIRDSDSGTKAVLGFQGNRLWTGLGYSPIYPDMGVASAYDIPFNFEMTMNVTTGTYSLSLNGTPIPEMQDYPLYGGELSRIEVAFGGAGNDYIFVDDILIMADCSFVATEETSWGNVKAYYR
jgi:hypothetical protein